MHWLADTSDFVAKSHCGPGWTQGLLYLYVLANALEFVLYQAFPFLVLWYLVPRHLRIVRPALSGLVLFVSTCGLTHLAEMLTVWWPAYRVVVSVHLLNVLTSTAGLCWLIIAIGRIRYVPIRSDLEGRLTVLQDEIKGLRASLATAPTKEALEILGDVIGRVQAARKAKRRADARG